MVGGRVFGTSGRGVLGATVIMIDSNGDIRYTRTNPFGFFSFADVQSGQSIILNVNHKKHRFAPQFLSLTEEVTSLTFIAQP
jgi:hypothetical protein